MRIYLKLSLFKCHAKVEQYLWRQLVFQSNLLNGHHLFLDLPGDPQKGNAMYLMGKIGSKLFLCSRNRDLTNGQPF